jgi:hypothetical protein
VHDNLSQVPGVLASVSKGPTTRATRPICSCRLNGITSHALPLLCHPARCPSPLYPLLCRALRRRLPHIHPKHLGGSDGGWHLAKRGQFGSYCRMPLTADRSTSAKRRALPRGVSLSPVPSAAMMRAISARVDAPLRVLWKTVRHRGEGSS